MTDVSQRQDATIRDFLNVVLRRKYVVLSIVLLTTTIIVFLSAAQPKVYVSSARILVKRGELSDAFLSRRTVLTWREEVSSQIEVILSEPVFARAAEVFADSMAQRGLEGRAFNGGAVRADVVGESNVFRIAYASIDPVECVVGCTAVTAAYREYYRERSSPPQVEAYFGDQINDAIDSLEHWRSRKSSFLAKERFLGAGEEGRLHSFKLERLEISLSEVESDLSALSLRLERLENLRMLPPEELDRNLALGGERNDLQTALMRDIKLDLQKVRLQREELLQKYTPRHPDVAALDGQIRDLLLQVVNEVENVYRVEKARQAELLAKRQSLLNDVNETRSAIKDLPRKDAELNRIEDQIGAHGERYETLLKRRNEAEIAQASTPEWQVTVLSPPSSAWPSKTRDYIRLAVGPFLSLIVGLGVAFFLESLDHSLKNAGEVEQYLGQKVLTTFADAGERKR